MLKGAPSSIRDKVLPLIGCAALIALVGATMYLQSQASIVLEWVSSSGLTGCLVMVLLVFVVGLPWAMGYSVVAIAVGFLYGFWGLPLLLAGNLLSYEFLPILTFSFCPFVLLLLTENTDKGFNEALRFLFCLLLVRKFGQECFLAKIQHFKHLQTTLKAVNYEPVMFPLLLRVTPIANGWTSTILAISSITPFTYFWTSVVGHVPKDLMYILFGHYTVESLSSAFQGTAQQWSDTKTILVVAQGVIFVTAISLLAVLGRRTMKKLEAEVGEPENDVSINSAANNEEEILP